jgi:hypothetical protein
MNLLCKRCGHAVGAFHRDMAPIAMTVHAG